MTSRCICTFEVATQTSPNSGAPAPPGGGKLGDATVAPLSQIVRSGSQAPAVSGACSSRRASARPVHLEQSAASTSRWRASASSKMEAPPRSTSTGLLPFDSRRKGAPPSPSAQNLAARSKVRHLASPCPMLRDQGNVQGLQRGVATGPRLSSALGLAAVVGGLVLAFIVLNTQQVSVDWIVTTTKTPLIVVILFSLVVAASSSLRHSPSANGQPIESDACPRSALAFSGSVRAGASASARRSDVRFRRDLQEVRRVLAARRRLRRYRRLYRRSASERLSSSRSRGGNRRFVLFSVKRPRGRKETPKSNLPEWPPSG